jgi:acetyl esterase/lipase
MRLRIVCLAALAALSSAAPAVARSVVAPARTHATVVLLAGNAWSGTTEPGKQAIYEQVGRYLERAGHRVVVADYPAGVEAGLAAVNAAVQAELEADPARPLCLYGESSGGHLALLAAEIVRGVDCVATVAAPADLHLWAHEEDAAPDTTQAITFRTHIVPAFGSDPAGWLPFEPALHTDRLPKLVLSMAGADDATVPLDQLKQLPGRHYVLPPGSLPFVHGTTTPGGLAELRRRVVGLVARATRARPSGRRR